MRAAKGHTNMANWRYLVFLAPYQHAWVQARARERYPAAPAAGQGSYASRYLRDLVEGDMEREAAAAAAAVDTEMEPELLARTAERCELLPGFVAYAFRTERVSREWTEERLAAFLGCDLDGLHRMALCFEPRPEYREKDLAAIATLGGVNPKRLAELLGD